MSAVRIERTIAAPPDRVYRAWLDPQVMVRWFAPAGFVAARAEADPRVGGRIAVWHRDDDGPVGGVLGQIVDLVPDRRIVLRLWFTDPDDPLDPAQESRLTLTFAPDGAGTRLTLVHDRLDGLHAARPDVADGVQPGWASALDSLTTTVTED